MVQLVQCQAAIVPWGTKARYSSAKLGLIRKGSQVFIAVFTHTNQQKFLIKPGSVRLLPAAIRIMDIQSDLFTKHISDEQKFATMLRGIRVLLRRDELRQNGKGDKLEQFIADIPQLSSLRRSDLQIPTQTLRLGHRETIPAPLVSLPSNHFVSADQIDPLEQPVGLSGRELDYYYEMQRKERQRLENNQLKCIKLIGLLEIPKQLWSAHSLNELQLVDCNLTRIPKQLEKLALTLNSLDLSKNKIKKLPRTFCCKMNTLIYLNLSYNSIETLPLEIKFLQHLREFNISNNRLKMLPTTLSDLRRLKVLRVDSNKLSQLPAFRREDIRLEILDISHNPLDGALRQFSTFEVHSSYHDQYDPYTLSFFSSPLIPPTSKDSAKKKVPTLFEISILNVVRSDDLFKLASEEPLPRTIVSTIQRDIFKCYRCNQMNILPAYNSTDTLDYIDHVESLISSNNYSSAMTFMKLLCRACFDRIIS